MRRSRWLGLLAVLVAFVIDDGNHRIGVCTDAAHPFVGEDAGEESPDHPLVIVENLLSNALKYTPPGGVIDLSLSTGGSSVWLDVRDTGPGVDAGDRDRIFDWFYSGPRPPDSIVAGSGLGLAIAQEYAEQHDGRIELLPGSGGAHFRLTLQMRMT